MKARQLALALGVLALAVRFSAPLQAADRMAVGEWEYTMTTKGESRVAKSCVKKEVADIANGDSRLGRAAAERKSAKTNCKVTDFAVEGNTVSYTLGCGDRTIKSTGTYHGDHFEGTLETKSPSEEVVTDIKARRLGACP